MNLSTFIVLLAVAAAFVFGIRSAWKNRNSACGHNCSECSAVCHYQDSMKKARRDIQNSRESHPGV